MYVWCGVVPSHYCLTSLSPRSLNQFPLPALPGNRGPSPKGQTGGCVHRLWHIQYIHKHFKLFKHWDEAGLDGGQIRSTIQIFNSWRNLRAARFLDIWVCAYGVIQVSSRNYLTFTHHAFSTRLLSQLLLPVLPGNLGPTPTVHLQMILGSLSMGTKPSKLFDDLSFSVGCARICAGTWSVSDGTWVWSCLLGPLTILQTVHGARLCQYFRYTWVCCQSSLLCRWQFRGQLAPLSHIIRCVVDSLTLQVPPTTRMHAQWFMEDENSKKEPYCCESI